VTVTLRAAAAEDAAALADIARETFLDMFGDLYPPADRDPYVAATYGEAIQRREIADKATAHCLAFEDGALIGYAKAGAYKLPVPAIDGRPYELHRLYLRSTAQGHGIADALMAWTLDCARAAGAEAIYLGVYQQNFRAQRFYARHGFEPFGEYFFIVGRVRDPEFILRRAL
jgi:GNAT superfamily N-acetyltransferase